MADPSPVAPARGGFSRTRLNRVFVAPVVTAASALLIAGCGGGADPDAAAAAERTTAPAGPSGKAARPLTVKQLAAALGCTPKITSKAADYRQATCTTSEAEHVLLDFDTAAGQRAWLDYAEMYGGIYLVGNRWALSAKSKKYMEGLAAELGGTVEERGAYGSSPEPSGS